MKDALIYIVSGIVDKPDQVIVDEEEQEGAIHFIVHVAQEDMGKVIGKNGKIIRAIRNVMKIPAIKQNRKIQISITE